MSENKRDYYLKLDTIEGESTAKGFEKQIDIVSFNWSEHQTGSQSSGGGSGAGRVELGKFQFTIKTNKATPKLLLACATGQVIPKAVFSLNKASGNKQETYLKYTLTNVMVSSFHTASDDPATPVPTDSFELGFERIEIEYKQQKGDQSFDAAVTAGFDQKTWSKV